MADTKDTKQDFRLAGLANDGWSTEDEATATCFCGAVQLAFPTKAPGLVNTFVCNCNDCHKITASMYASNFTIRDTHLRHLRGQENLKQFGQEKTIGSGKKMTNFFCNTCGSLMYRVGEAFPGMSILRIGTVDDFRLMETKLKPQVVQYVEQRTSWVEGVEGVREVVGIAI
ncbi:Mss4-like protein [Glarea lozoyensis ATCC 20868]|uniref:Mss4-like protein n=2 Tax=Glarea lozoyensis TaxID=101852 RepID=S3DAG8_GLAL2|nr:Mss4-like protein [Glarea lozoyensis ATCC 20868]EHL01142.1 hypothetical protein M7I_2835 [Glarea lozoyensis 74030]EPE35452.1 Mss4-like protein [Glarea lozoyensis ATCC 20868]